MAAMASNCEQAGSCSRGAPECAGPLHTPDHDAGCHLGCTPPGHHSPPQDRRGILGRKKGK